MEQRTLSIDGNIVYCYEDGSVEFLIKAGRYYGLHRTFGFVDVHGYLVVRMNNKYYKVHRLIAMAFHANPDKKPEVDHIDRNKRNNNPDNLRWATRKENTDNRDYVEKSIEKYGVRSCNDKKTYCREYSKHCLSMTKPDGSGSRTGALASEVYNILKPLTQKERYFKYNELVKANK